MSIKKLVQMIVNKTTANSKPHPTPEQTPYDLMGGKPKVRELANRFYDIMASDPQAAELYAIHPLPLDNIRQKFFEFLSGWLGGPALFEQKYGHPRLRARHLPFQVDEKLRNQWMYCMDKALDEVIDNKLLRDGIRQSIGQLASHMINT
ncbi:hemoglobin [Arsukibacterium tuosuense]|uniref:Hemoglobin n=1 Tax=Arsukibacterium tuosuense TaxID=1323745 RepID=A0A285ILE7_9GAMM|nr:group II truncated hemoglobin [Arsukibacterium tuosuense]SNY48788.1 hemoglobin [Arsukibacterium tuosuense]